MPTGVVQVVCAHLLDQRIDAHHVRIERVLLRFISVLVLTHGIASAQSKEKTFSSHQGAFDAPGLSLLASNMSRESVDDTSTVCTQKIVKGSLLPCSS